MRFNIDGPNVVKVIKTNIEKIKDQEKNKAKPETELQKKKRKRKIERTKKRVGTLGTNGLKKLSIGLQMLEGFVSQQGENLSKSLLIGNEDVSIQKKIFFEYQGLILNILRSSIYKLREEFDAKQDIDLMPDAYSIMQAARDNVLIQQVTRKEKIDGIDTEVKYDRAMSQGDVAETIDKYYRLSNGTELTKITNYLMLGLSLAGAIGELTTRKKANEQDDFGKIITIGTISVSGVKLITDAAIGAARERARNAEVEEKNIRGDFLYNEQVSNSAIDSAINTIEEKIFHSLYENARFENVGLSIDLVKDLIVAVLYGMYINKNIQLTPEGKINGKSLAQALISLRSATEYAQGITRSIGRINSMKKDIRELDEIKKEYKFITDQMEEKVYPLVGTDEPIDRLEIKDFEGNFYPKKNYQTGEIEYGSKLKVPEFSIKRGETVLLSGDSGAGKSTFLRLLKRGDINSRNCILLDGEKRVDNLGSEFISFRPSMDLGDGENVLFQITGKQSITDLTPDEIIRMDKILSELNLDFPNRFDALASKTFTEFSTGQQRRLALSKLFYRINDGTSVIIVDEPVRKCWR